jgi:hypothetical protein
MMSCYTIIGAFLEYIKNTKIFTVSDEFLATTRGREIEHTRYASRRLQLISNMDAHTEQASL